MSVEDVNELDGSGIAIEHLNKEFRVGAGKTFQAISDINLKIPAGAFVSLIGPSGCGDRKSVV